MVHSYAPHEDRRPRQITPQSSADWFETITRAVFNAGMSWSIVEERWPAIGEAFAAFEPAEVARFDESVVDRIASDDRVIRNRHKIRATVANARMFVQLAEEHGSFAEWLASLEGYDARERALVSAMRYVGDFGAYWILYTTRQAVPGGRRWSEDHGREPLQGL